MSIHLAMSRGTPEPGHTRKQTTRRRGRLLAVLAALALPFSVVVAPYAAAGTTPPFTIGDEDPGPGVTVNIPGSDATGPNSSNPDDPEGNVKELGPLNQNTTKIAVIHKDQPPTLGLTNPNGQVDLRQAWINAKNDGPGGTGGDDWVYFAWERDANTGSGFIAYEFMQKATPTVCGTYDPTSTTVLNECNPWANRDGDTDYVDLNNDGDTADAGESDGPDIGDFFIMWDQQGGSKDLYYRKWVGTAPNLTLTPPVLLTSDVAIAAYSTDGFRGEAAINITDVVFGGTPTCLAFANIIPSTVTGNSDSADYKDTILQPGIDLANCTTDVTTTPMLADGTTTVPTTGVSITTAGVVEVKDSAYITLAGGTAPAAGDIDFTLCEANTAGSADCDATGKSVAIDVDKPVSGTFPITVVSSSAWITKAGRYCWKADYSGNPTNGYSGDADVSTGECFVVNPVTPTLSTTAGADVVLGSAVTDVATLAGTAPKPTTNVIETSDPDALSRTAAGGSIRFKLIGPNDCTTVAYDSDATTPKQNATVSGDNDYNASYTPTAAQGAGDYHWVAYYSGDSPNTLSRNHNAATDGVPTCTETGEDVTVLPASTTTLTSPRVGSTAISGPVAVGTSVTDHAVVTGTAAGGSPAGTVDFFVCSPSQLDADGLCGSGGTAAGADKPLTAGAGNTATADSDAVVANVVGKWCFRAVYKSNTDNYTGSSDSSATECFTVKDTTSASSEQDWLPNDTATITATGGTALNGTLAFTLYSGNNCGATSGSALGYSKSFTLTNATSLADRTKTTDNSSIKVTSTSTVSWLVRFTSSDSLVGSSSHCEVTSLTITN